MSDNKILIPSAEALSPSNGAPHWLSQPGQRQTVATEGDDDDDLVLAAAASSTSASASQANTPSTHDDDEELPPPSYEASTSPNTSTLANPLRTPDSVELDGLHHDETSDTARLLVPEESNMHITMPNKQGYQKYDAMKWDNIETNGRWDRYDLEPGTWCASTGGCVFSARGGCCFGDRDGCCCADRDGCCFSDRGGCCCADTDGCCFASEDGCCCARQDGCCFAENDGCCFGASGGETSWLDGIVCGTVPPFLWRRWWTT